MKMEKFLHLNFSPLDWWCILFEASAQLPPSSGPSSESINLSRRLAPTQLTFLNWDDDEDQVGSAAPSLKQWQVVVARHAKRK